MVIVQVFSENVKIKYKSTFFSKATVFSIVTGVICLIIPYLIAYQTENFWIDKINFHIQPKVNMRGEYLVIALTDNLSHPIICSTFPSYKKDFNDLDNCIFFMIRETDKNFDGKSDQLDLTVRINVFTLQITSLMLVLPINIELKTICPIRMQSAIIFQHDFQQKYKSDFLVRADLSFYQRSVLNCDETQHNVYDYPIISGDMEQEFEIDKIFKSYFERNFTTHLTNIHTHIKNEHKDVFNINLLVQYPEQQMYYKPGFWYSIKQAWIQYFAIFIIVSWILNKIRSYMYHKRWLLFYKELPINKNMKRE